MVSKNDGIKLSNEEVFEEVQGNIKEMLWSRGMRKEDVEIEKVVGNKYILLVHWPRREKASVLVFYAGTTWITIETECVGVLNKFAQQRRASKKGEEGGGGKFRLVLVLKSVPQGIRFNALSGFERIETFLDEDFYMDKKTYHLWPRSVRVLSPEEVERLVSPKGVAGVKASSKRGTSNSSPSTSSSPYRTDLFSPIGAHDALAQYYGLKVGDVIHVLNNMTQQVEEEYQICVDS